MLFGRYYQLTLNFISILLLMCGTAAFTTFFSLYIDAKTTSAFYVGFTQAAFFTGYICGAHFAPRFIRKLGFKKCYFYHVFAVCLSQILMAKVETFLPWTLLRFSTGIFVSVLYVALESSLFSSLKTKRRGSLFSLFMVGLYLSQASGQFIYDWTKTIDNLPFTLSIILPLLSLIPIGLQSQRSQKKDNIENLSLIYFFQKFTKEMMFSTVAGTLVGVFFIFGPVLLEKEGLAAGHVMGTALVGAIFFQFPIGALSDIWAKSRLIQTLSLVIVLTLIILPTKILIYPLAFLFGGALFSLYPLMLSQLAGKMHSSQYTALCAKVLLTYSIGSIIGPLICALTLPTYSVMLILSLFAVSISLVLSPAKQKKSA